MLTDPDNAPPAKRGCCTAFIECTPFPPDDDGVPPGCHHRFCPLDLGFFVNHLSIAKSFGKCGLAYMDKHRRLLFGIASWTTVGAFVLGIWGCLALTTGASVVQRAYWVGARVTDNTNNQQYSMYVGLRSFEYVNCGFVPGYESYPTGCTRSSIKFTDDACSNGPFAAACQACDTNAKSMWTTAFFGCTGLILAWLGQQTRMRPCADSPVQKLMGVFSEVMGVGSTAVAMFQFNAECKGKLMTAVTNSNFTGTYNLGPGYICFVLVTCSGVVRFIVNALVPLPPPAVPATSERGGEGGVYDGDMEMPGMAGPAQSRREGDAPFAGALGTTATPMPAAGPYAAVKPPPPPLPLPQQSQPLPPIVNTVPPPVQSQEPGLPSTNPPRLNNPSPTSSPASARPAPASVPLQPPPASSNAPGDTYSSF